jgi:hypothetical protein
MDFMKYAISVCTKCDRLIECSLSKRHKIVLEHHVVEEIIYIFPDRLYTTLKSIQSCLNNILHRALPQLIWLILRGSEQAGKYLRSAENKWKHSENKYINKFKQTTIQNIPNHKLKILKAGSQKNIICSPNLRYVYRRTQN